MPWPKSLLRVEMASTRNFCLSCLHPYVILLASQTLFYLLYAHDNVIRVEMASVRKFCHPFLRTCDGILLCKLRSAIVYQYKHTIASFHVVILLLESCLNLPHSFCDVQHYEKGPLYIHDVHQRPIPRGLKPAESQRCTSSRNACSPMFDNCVLSTSHTPGIFLPGMRAVS